MRRLSRSSSTGAMISKPVSNLSKCQTVGNGLVGREDRLSLRYVDAIRPSGVWQLFVNSGDRRCDQVKDPRCRPFG